MCVCSSRDISGRELPRAPLESALLELQRSAEVITMPAAPCHLQQLCLNRIHNVLNLPRPCCHSG